MASPAKTHPSLALLLLAALLSSLQVHGRESKFFSKVTHVTNVTKVATPAPAPAEVEVEADTHSGYGLFGRDSGQSETNTRDENETPNNNGYNSERQGMSDTRFMENGKYYYDPSKDNTNNEGLNGESLMSTNNNNNNGYNTNTERQGMSDTRFMANGKYYYDPSNDNNNHYNTNAGNEGLAGESLMSTTNNNGYTNTYNNAYNNNGYNTNMERQGMSDTRFMENGKYYYDPSNENTNNEGLTGESLMSNNNGYNTNGYERQGRNMDNNDDNYVGGFETEQKETTGGYNGNNEKYEFDTMEEYEKYEQSKRQGYWP